MASQTLVTSRYCVPNVMVCCVHTTAMKLYIQLYVIMFMHRLILIFMYVCVCVYSDVQ